MVALWGETRPADEVELPLILAAEEILDRVRLSPRHRALRSALLLRLALRGLVLMERTGGTSQRARLFHGIASALAYPDTSGPPDGKWKEHVRKFIDVDDGPDFSTRAAKLAWTMAAEQENGDFYG